MTENPFRLLGRGNIMYNFSLKRLSGLYLHYLYSMRRNPARIIEILIWPGIEVVLFAILASSQLDQSQEGARVTLNILTGIVYWNCTARVIQETTAQFIDDFTSKNIQSLLITPISLAELIVGITAASLTKIIISLTMLGLILAFIYPSFMLAAGPQIFLWVILLELVGVSLSLFAIAAICLFGERIGFVGWLLSTVLQIFSLVFYERSALPPVLQHISYAVPSSYIFESIRSYPAVPYLSLDWAAWLIVGYTIAGAISVSLAFRVAKHFGTFTKI